MCNSLLVRIMIGVGLFSPTSVFLISFFFKNYFNVALQGYTCFFVVVVAFFLKTNGLF